VIDGKGMIRIKLLGSPPTKFEKLQELVTPRWRLEPRHPLEVKTVSVTKEQVLSALRAVQDPDLNKDIVSLGFVKDVTITGGEVDFTIELTTPACPVKDVMKLEAEAGSRRCRASAPRARR